MKKLLIISALILFTAQFALHGEDAEKKNLSKDASAQEKFRAHKIVNKLTPFNKKRIEFIETVTKNFPYGELNNVKEDFHRAGLFVTGGDIIAARNLLLKNKEDIYILMKKIARDYQKRSKEIINDSAHTLSSYHLKAMDGTSVEKNAKLSKNQKRMKVAANHMEDALKNFHHGKYQSSIYQYRNAKIMAIFIMNDLADRKEKVVIKEKYKLDMADNKHNYHGHGEYDTGHGVYYD